MDFNIKVKNILRSKNAFLLLKLTVILIAVLFLLNSLRADGFGTYLNSEDFDIQNDIASGTAEKVHLNKIIEQEFVSQGDTLRSVSIFISGKAAEGSLLDLRVIDKSGSYIYNQTADLSKMAFDTWNSIDVNIENLSRGERYTLQLSSDSDTAMALLGDDQSGARDFFGNVVVGGSESAKSLAVGMQFTYKYITLAALLYLVLRGVIFCTLLTIFIYGAVYFEKYYEVFVKNNNNWAGMFAAFFAFVMILQANPMDRLSTKVSSFTREMGIGLAAGYDFTKAASNFMCWFALFAMFFCVYYLVANYWLSFDEGEDGSKIRQYSKDFIVIANVNLLLRAITYFDDEALLGKVFYYSFYEILLIAVCIIFFIAFKIYKKGITPEQYLKSFIASAAGTFVICALLGTEWESGRLALGVQALLFAFIIAVSMLLKRIKRKPLSNIYVMGISAFPLLMFLYIELINALNQHCVFITDLRVYLLIFSVIWLAALFAVTKIKGFDNIKLPDWKNISYPLLVFGISALAVQIPLQSVYGADLFEYSNHSILLSDFFYFGRIPIVEHLGHHMMSVVWENLVYALVNGDVEGSIFAPYMYYYTPFVALFFFCIVKKIWNGEAALAAALFFPFLNFWAYIGWGALVVFCAMNYVRKNSCKNAVLLWLSVVWCAVYRADLGYTFGIACVFTFIIYILLEKNLRAFRELSVSLIGVGLFFGALWFALCLMKSVDPITRLIEFFKLFAAGVNWAYNGIGDQGNTSYFWAYFAIPFFIVTALLYSVFVKKFREDIGYEKWILLMIFGLAYFANYSRAMQRHSLVEMDLFRVIFTGYIFISAFVTFRMKRKYIFIPVFTILILADTLFMQDANFTFMTLAEYAVTKEESLVENWTLGRFAGGSETPVWDGSDGSDEAIEPHEYIYRDGENESLLTYWELLAKIGKPINRVIYSDALKSQIKPFRDIIDELLDKDETFADFIYVDFLYSVLEKECPVYIVQSPTMLSGEYTQELFLEEIQQKKDNIPIVLMPNESGYNIKMDGLPLTYKYYKVAEYIYENYIPLCEDTQFSIWCRPDKYEEYLNKLKNFGEIDVLAALMKSNDFDVNNVNIVKNFKNNSITLKATGENPSLSDIQQYVDLSRYAGFKINLKVKYTSDVPGNAGLGYTTDNEENSVSVDIEESGEFDISIPFTEFTGLRLDIPEKSNFTIKSMNITKYPLIDYDYAPNVHNYSIKKLPLYWGEFDSYKAFNNEVLSEAVFSDGCFRIEDAAGIDKSNGNYLRIKTAYDGEEDYVPASAVLGHFDGKEFVEKARFDFEIEKGTNDYLIRVSSDFFWGLNEIDSIRLESEGNLYGTSMSILKA